MLNKSYKYLKQLGHSRLAWLVVIVTMSSLLALWPQRHAQAPTSPSSAPLQTSSAPAAPPQTASPAPTYPWHANIIATMFYVGEGASDDNGHISNHASAWDEQWLQHFGGVDKPNRRAGWLPAGFAPKENPFYVALPYNDFDESGRQKPSAQAIYWFAPSPTSQLKNTWVEICRGDVCAYGQWEDVGPYGEDDSGYVFGTNPPANQRDAKAGIDLSPALNDYLKLDGQATVSWRFVPPDQVPDGPWQHIITR